MALSNGAEKRPEPNRHAVGNGSGLPPSDALARFSTLTGSGGVQGEFPPATIRQRRAPSPYMSVQGPSCPSATCSSAAYPSVYGASDRVCFATDCFAAPKSINTGRSSGLRIKTFAGLMSRCRSPARCTCIKPSASGTTTVSRSASSNGRPAASRRRSTSESGCPSTKSITRYSVPLSRKKSRHSTMFGCPWRSISAFASSRKRRRPFAKCSSQSALLGTTVFPSRTASSAGRYSLMATR